MKNTHADNSRHLILAKYCATLSNPTRVAILEAVAAQAQCVEEFIEMQGLSRFTVGQNLKELKKYKIINGTFSSSNTSYCIDYERLEEFKMLFDNLYLQLIKNKGSVNPMNKICGVTLTNK